MNREEDLSNPMGVTTSEKGPDLRKLPSRNVESQFQTQCFEERLNSLKCLEKNGAERSKCQPVFDAYKDCVKREQEARREERRKRTAASGGW